jgi:hypothetical protein
MVSLLNRSEHFYAPASQQRGAWASQFGQKIKRGAREVRAALGSQSADARQSWREDNPPHSTRFGRVALRADMSVAKLPHRRGIQQSGEYGFLDQASVIATIFSPASADGIDGVQAVRQQIVAKTPRQPLYESHLQVHPSPGPLVTFCWIFAGRFNQIPAPWQRANT